MNQRKLLTNILNSDKLLTINDKQKRHNQKTEAALKK